MTGDTSQPWLVGERWSPNSAVTECVLLGTHELCGLAQTDGLGESVSFKALKQGCQDYSSSIDDPGRRRLSKLGCPGSYLRPCQNCLGSCL